MSVQSLQGTGGLFMLYSFRVTLTLCKDFSAICFETNSSPVLALKSEPLGKAYGKTKYKVSRTMQIGAKLCPAVGKFHVLLW